MPQRLRRNKVIVIRPPTPSRRAITVVVSQYRDDLGQWMAPTITFVGPMAPIIESARFARDIGQALIVAAYHADVMMKFVTNGHKAHDILDEDDKGLKE